MNEIKKQPKVIHLDTTLIDKIQNYGTTYGLSFSSVIRLVANDFFLKQGGK
jgi:hypothetical protein